VVHGVGQPEALSHRDSYPRSRSMASASESTAGSIVRRRHVRLRRKLLGGDIFADAALTKNWGRHRRSLCTDSDHVSHSERQ